MCEFNMKPFIYENNFTNGFLTPAHYLEVSLIL